MHARAVAGRRHLYDHLIGQVRNEAAVGHVDGVEPPVLAARERLNDGNGELAGRFERLLLEPLRLVLLLLERAVGAESILHRHIVRHFARLPGSSVRRVVEPVQLVGAELVRPTNIFADVIARRRRIKPEPPQQDAPQPDLVPVREPAAFALRRAQPRIKIVAGAAVADGLEPAEVIDAARLHLHLVHGLVENVDDLLHSHPHPVTEPEASCLRQRRDRVAHLVHRVGVVEQEGVRADALHRASDRGHGPHGAQPVEERAWPAILGKDLAETVFARDVVVLRPIEVAPDLDRGDDELRALERGLERSRRADLRIAV